MSLEAGRAMMQGIMILIFAAVANWVSAPVGLGLVGFVGLMKLQEAVTDWCPSDLLFKPMGLKRRGGV